MKKALAIWVFLFLAFSGTLFAAGFSQDQASKTWFAPDKDPGAKLDYSIDWTQWLAGDTISASSWTASTGIIVEATSYTTTAATIWISGGTAGQTYTATNKITTTASRVTEQTFKIKIRDL